MRTKTCAIPRPVIAHWPFKWTPMSPGGHLADVNPTPHFAQARTFPCFGHCLPCTVYAFDVHFLLCPCALKQSCGGLGAVKPSPPQICCTRTMPWCCYAQDPPSQDPVVMCTPGAAGARSCTPPQCPNLPSAHQMLCAQTLPLTVLLWKVKHCVTKATPGSCGSQRACPLSLLAWQSVDCT